LICRLYHKQLSAYLDGELPTTRAARLEAHLRVCPHCRGELDSMVGIADRVRAASRELTVSQDFDQRVLRAVGYLQVYPTRTVQRPSLRSVALVLAALAALLGMMWHYLLRPPVPEPAPQPGAAMVAPAPIAPGTPPSPGQQRER
jgi:anti-sigma factor RsiW